MEYSLLLSGLESLLGKSHKKSRDNYAFHCPFCNHKKPKLEINLRTDDKGENKFACWVCRTRGTTIRSLLKQLKVPSDQARPILTLVHRSEESYYKLEEEIRLPEEFQSLWEASTESVVANNIKKYLFNRNISEIELLKYNLGYCTSGDYEGRIIIPSYDKDNKLNFFTARSYQDSFYKYKNPPFPRDIIFFENTINWNLPLVLVEGPFDAIAVKRNAIPILGQSLSLNLLKRIVSNEVQEIYVALDKDALKQAISFCMKFLDMGKKVYMVDMDDKDPSEMGFRNITQKIKEARQLTTSDIIKYKLEL